MAAKATIECTLCEPVSYTHLEPAGTLLKRAAGQASGAGRPHGAGAHPVCDRQQTDCDDPAFFQTGDGAFQRVGGSGAAVSYTHLDVYKRQDMSGIRYHFF